MLCRVVCVGTMKNFILLVPCLVLWVTSGGCSGMTILEKLAQDTDLSEVSAHQETEDATKRTTGTPVLYYLIISCRFYC